MPESSLAEVLRERGPAAETVTGTPPVQPTELQRLSADTMGQFREAVERRTAAAKERAATLVPALGATRQAIEQEIATLPTPVPGPTLTAPPPRGLSAFLAPREGESSEASLGKLIAAMGLFATGASGLVRKDARAGLAALTGAMKGWREGDRERADRAFADWDARTTAALKQWEVERQGYQDIMAKANLTLQQKMNLVNLAMLEHGVLAEPFDVEVGGLEKMVTFITGREDAAQKLGIAMIQLQTAKEYREEQRQFQIWLENYKTTLAKQTRGEQVEEELDKPIGPKASEYVHPPSLMPPPPTLTQRQLLEGGYVKADQKAREALAGLTQTHAIVANVETLAKGLITATNPAEALAQYARLEVGARTQANPQARVYNDAKQAFLGILSRTMGGERGVLTDRDIARIDRMLPGFGDTISVMDQKLNQLRVMLRTATNAQQRLILGQPGGGSREEIEKAFGTSGTGTMKIRRKTGDQTVHEGPEGPIPDGWERVR